MKAKFDVVGVLIRKATLFGKKSTACVIPPLVEKFADIKVRGVCLLCENTVFIYSLHFQVKGRGAETLMVLAERMTLNYVSMQVSSLHHLKSYKYTCTYQTRSSVL